MATGLGKVSFHSNPKERQCQRMLKLLHSCTYLTHWKSKAQNSPSQASIVQAGYRKDHHDPDNHDGMITHPDILEYEVKSALGNITKNKANGGDGVPAELFQIQKDDAIKCCTQDSSKHGKLSSGHRTGKGQFSLQSQRRGMPENPQTTTQLHSSLMLAK